MGGRSLPFVVAASLLVALMPSAPADATPLPTLVGSATVAGDSFWVANVTVTAPTDVSLTVRVSTSKHPSHDAMSVWVLGHTGTAFALATSIAMDDRRHVFAHTEPGVPFDRTIDVTPRRSGSSGAELTMTLLSIGPGSFLFMGTGASNGPTAAVRYEVRSDGFASITGTSSGTTGFFDVDRAWNGTAHALYDDPVNSRFTTPDGAQHGSPTRESRAQAAADVSVTRAAASKMYSVFILNAQKGEARVQTPTGTNSGAMCYVHANREAGTYEYTAETFVGVGPVRGNPLSTKCDELSVLTPSNTMPVGIYLFGADVTLP